MLLENKCMLQRIENGFSLLIYLLLLPTPCSSSSLLAPPHSDSLLSRYGLSHSFLHAKDKASTDEVTQAEMSKDEASQDEVEFTCMLEALRMDAACSAADRIMGAGAGANREGRRQVEFMEEEEEESLGELEQKREGGEGGKAEEAPGAGEQAAAAEVAEAPAAGDEEEARLEADSHVLSAKPRMPRSAQGAHQDSSSTLLTLHLGVHQENTREHKDTSSTLRTLHLRQHQDTSPTAPDSTRVGDKAGLEASAHQPCAAYEEEDTCMSYEALMFTSHLSCTGVPEATERKDLQHSGGRGEDSEFMHEQRAHGGGHVTGRRSPRGKGSAQTPRACSARATTRAEGGAHGGGVVSKVPQRRNRRPTFERFSSTNYSDTWRPTHSICIPSSLSLTLQAAGAASTKRVLGGARAGVGGSTGNTSTGGGGAMTAAGAMWGVRGGRKAEQGGDGVRRAEEGATQDIRQLFWRSSAAQRWAGKGNLTHQLPDARAAPEVGGADASGGGGGDKRGNDRIGGGGGGGGATAAAKKEHAQSAQIYEVADVERVAQSVASAPSTPKSLAGLDYLDLSEIAAQQTGRKPPQAPATHQMDHHYQVEAVGDAESGHSWSSRAASAQLEERPDTMPVVVTEASSSSSSVSSSKASSRPASPSLPSVQGAAGMGESIPALPGLALSFKIMDLDSTFVFEEKFDAPRRAAALYAFPAAEEDELRLTQGQQVYLVGKAEDEWYIGINVSGKAGLVPANYITFVDSLPDLPREEAVVMEQEEAPCKYQDKDGGETLTAQSSADWGGESEGNVGRTNLGSLGEQNEEEEEEKEEEEAEEGSFKAEAVNGVDAEREDDGGEKDDGSSLSASSSSVSFKSSDLLDSLNAWEAKASKGVSKLSATAEAAASRGGGGGGGGAQTAARGKSFLQELEEGLSD